MSDTPSLPSPDLEKDSCVVRKFSDAASLPSLDAEKESSVMTETPSSSAVIKQDTNMDDIHSNVLAKMNKEGVVYSSALTELIKKDSGAMVTATEIEDSNKCENENITSVSKDSGVHVKDIVKELSSDKFHAENTNTISSEQPHELHSGKKDNEVKDLQLEKPKSSDWSPFSKRKCSPKTKRKENEGKFDQTTLELIREIGSAFLNSPDKPQTKEENQEKDAVADGSLVKFLVRNIEKQNVVPKKKHMQEVVILDKEAQKKKNAWRHSSPQGDSSLAPKQLDFTKAPLVHSCSSPQLGNISENIKSTTKLADNSNESSSLNTQNTHASSVITKDCMEDSSEDSDTKPVVRDLVGKFEHHDKPQESTSADLHKRSSPVLEVLDTKSKDDDHNNLDSKSSSISDQGEAHKTQDQGQTPNVKVISKVETSDSDDVLKSSDKDSETDDVVSDESVQLRTMKQNLRKVSATRPKSADNAGLRASRQRVRLSHSNTLPDDSDLSTGFSMEGRKVRKLQYGRSHPLSRLDARRKSPFYNTM